MVAIVTDEAFPGFQGSSRGIPFPGIEYSWPKLLNDPDQFIRPLKAVHLSLTFSPPSGLCENAEPAKGAREKSSGFHTTLEQIKFPLIT